MSVRKLKTTKEMTATLRIQVKIIAQPSDTYMKKNEKKNHRRDRINIIYSQNVVFPFVLLLFIQNKVWNRT